MKYLLLIVLGLIFPAYAIAEKVTEEVVTVQLPCYDTKMIFEKLRKVYKESPILIGKTTDAAASVMSLWINPTTNTWTIIATKDTLSCIIGVGTDFTLIPTKNQKEI